MISDKKVCSEILHRKWFLYKFGAFKRSFFETFLNNWENSSNNSELLKKTYEKKVFNNNGLTDAVILPFQMHHIIIADAPT